MGRTLVVAQVLFTAAGVTLFILAGSILKDPVGTMGGVVALLAAGLTGSVRTAFRDLELRVRKLERDIRHLTEPEPAEAA